MYSGRLALLYGQYVVNNSSRNTMELIFDTHKSTSLYTLFRPPIPGRSDQDAERNYDYRHYFSYVKNVSTGTNIWSCLYPDTNLEHIPLTVGQRYAFRFRDGVDERNLTSLSENYPKHLLISTFIQDFMSAHAGNHKHNNPYLDYTGDGNEGFGPVNTDSSFSNIPWEIIEPFIKLTIDRSIKEHDALYYAGKEDLEVVGGDYTSTLFKEYYTEYALSNTQVDQFRSTYEAKKNNFNTTDGEYHLFRAHIWNAGNSKFSNTDPDVPTAPTKLSEVINDPGWMFTVRYINQMDSRNNLGQAKNITYSNSVDENGKSVHIIPNPNSNPDPDEKTRWASYWNNHHRKHRHGDHGRVDRDIMLTVKEEDLGKGQPGPENRESKSHRLLRHTLYNLAPDAWKLEHVINPYQIAFIENLHVVLDQTPNVSAKNAVVVTNSAAPAVPAVANHNWVINNLVPLYKECFAHDTVEKNTIAFTFYERYKKIIDRGYLFSYGSSIGTKTHMGKRYIPTQQRISRIELEKYFRFFITTLSIPIFTTSSEYINNLYANADLVFPDLKYPLKLFLPVVMVNPFDRELDVPLPLGAGGNLVNFEFRLSTTLYNLSQPTAFMVAICISHPSSQKRWVYRSTAPKAVPADFNIQTPENVYLVNGSFDEPFADHDTLVYFILNARQFNVVDRTVADSISVTIPNISGEYFFEVVGVQSEMPPSFLLREKIGLTDRVSYRDYYQRTSVTVESYEQYVYKAAPPYKKHVCTTPHGIECRSYLLGQSSVLFDLVDRSAGGDDKGPPSPKVDILMVMTCSIPQHLYSLDLGVLVYHVVLEYINSSGEISKHVYNDYRTASDKQANKSPELVEIDSRNVCFYHRTAAESVLIGFLQVDGIGDAFKVKVVVDSPDGYQG